MWHDELQLNVEMGWVTSFIPGTPEWWARNQKTKNDVTFEQGEKRRREKQACLISASVKNTVMQGLQRRWRGDSRWVYLELKKFLNVLIKSRIAPDSKKINVYPTCKSRRATNNSAVTCSWLPGVFFTSSLFFPWVQQGNRKTHWRQKLSRKILECTMVSIPVAQLTYRCGIVYGQNRSAPHGTCTQSKQLIFWVLNI